MAQLVNLTVMGGTAAPFNADGSQGNPYQNKIGGSVNGVSEVVAFLVMNIIKINDYVQPASGTQYPAVASVVRYKGVNPTNGASQSIKMYVHETRAAIITAAG